MSAVRRYSGTSRKEQTKDELNILFSQVFINAGDAKIFLCLQYTCVAPQPIGDLKWLVQDLFQK
jgi:hypothetical protein